MHRHRIAAQRMAVVEQAWLGCRLVGCSPWMDSSVAEAKPWPEMESVSQVIGLLACSGRLVLPPPRAGWLVLRLARSLERCGEKPNKKP